MTSHFLGQLGVALQDLGWEAEDEIVVEIGGVSVSGIHQKEGANPKWAAPYGDTRLQKDAFIVIKNKSRNPVIPSNNGSKV